MKLRDRIKSLRRVAVKDLRPNPKNWRVHPEEQQNAMQGILAEVGIADALLVRETDDGLQLIDGHLRADIAPDTKWPVLVLDVTESEADKLLATIDPIAGMADIDTGKLSNLLGDIQFDSEALDDMLGDLIPPEIPEIEEDEAPIDQAEELQKKWKTERGQLWQIGRHRLMCGDATDEQDVKRAMGDLKPFIMVTDPPYGVNYDPNWRNEAAKAGKLSYAASRVGTVKNDEIIDWSPAYLLFTGDVAYTWSPSGDHVIITGQSMQKAGFQIRSQIIWRKSHFPISRGHYTYRHEPCWYGVRKGRTSKWCGDNNASTIWELNLDKNVEGGHSTQKPVECMARPIRNHGDKQDHVYDPFLGSGTTMAAAEQLDRTCIGLEISPEYCAVILQRMTNLGVQCKHV